MIIKNLVIKNFFRVYGEVKIECANTPTSNVTVIKGDNGTGKTTMLSAFHWAFYGEVIDPLVVGEMLNKRARAELKEGDSVESSVQVEISDKGVNYIFLRKLIFKKVNGEVISDGQPEVLITNLSTNPPSPVSKDFFNNIIPKKLSGFFFFDGERIDRLAKIDGKSEIKQAILDLLGLTNIDNISSYLAPIKQDFNRELSKLSQSAETSNLTKELEEVLNKIQTNNSALERIAEEIKKNKKIKEECEQFLKNHNAEQVRTKEEAREKLYKETEQIDAKIEDEKAKILKHISRNFRFNLISSSFESISAFLEDKRQKKLLPSDIKETFINDLLESHSCICGRPLVEGTPEYNNLLKLKETAGKQELDESYSRLASFVKSSFCNEAKESFYSPIYQYKQLCHNADLRKEEIKKDLSDIKKFLSNIDDALITAKENLRDNAEDKITEYKAKELQGKSANEQLKKREQELNTKISQAQDKDKGANTYRKSYDLAYELEKLNTRIHEFFVDITQEDMDNNLKQVFGLLARKQDREPSLSKNFELQIINKDTKQPQILSTGERQITSLAFIGAMVSYAKDKFNMGLMSDFSGGDYPIVMDSPFGNLDPTHKENVAKGIPALASQVIVIVSDAQWNGIVAESMKDKVGAVYEMTDGYTTVADSEFTEFRRVL